jgi:hypothetical protein
MSKFVDFILHLGEDMYKSESEKINKRYDIREISTNQNPAVEPATSVESLKK